MEIIRDMIEESKLTEIAKSQFGSFVKAVVDLKRRVMAIGGELHADEEALLIEDGSEQNNLWGINLYPEKSEEEWIQFDSMINIRPSRDNLSRSVENEDVRMEIAAIIKTLVV